MQQRATQELLGGSMSVSNKDKIEVLSKFAEKLCRKVSYYRSHYEYENAQFCIDCAELVYDEIRQIEEEVLTFKDSNVFRAAVRLFSGDQIRAYDWIHTEIPALGGERPIDCDEQDVLDLIGKIEHGVFA